MTRVDFYVLSSSEAKGRQQLACRLADKAYQLGHKVYIHTDSPEQTQQMDTLLWTFRQNSFLPHAKTDNAGEDPPLVLLGNDTEPANHAEVLINLSTQIPEFFSQFDRVTEVINQEPQYLQSGREHYRFYKDRGYPLETHKLEE